MIPALDVKSGLKEFRVLTAAVVVVMPWIWHCKVLSPVKAVPSVFPELVYNH